jgi:hypothetical protein
VGRNVIARQDGDDYQAKFFWLKACGLNHSHTCIKKVAWEMDSTFGFDDVVVFYDPPIMESGSSIEEDYYQLKFHVDHARGFTCHALMDPEFIGAERESLLQRLYRNYLKDPAKYLTCRYYIVNAWTLDHSDELRNLLGNNGGLRLEVLFKGGENSKYGKIRAAWKQHLGINDDRELRLILTPLRIRHNYDAQLLRENLNDRLKHSGFKPVPENQQSSKYGDLIQKLHKDGKNIFTKDELLDICRREELLEEIEEAKEDSFIIGIRSFQRGAETLELEVHALQCFLHCFSGRFILEEFSGTGYINEQLAHLSEKAILSKKRIIVHLDTHLSIAMLFGYYMDSKYGGLDITIIQKTFSGKLLWRAEAEKINTYSQPLLTLEEEKILDSELDLALSISVTHDIRDDVQAHIQRKLQNVSSCLHFVINPKTGVASIKDASQIVAAVEELIAGVRAKRRKLGNTGTIHLFISAPNAFAFYLGQRIKQLGNIVLYEYDFENQRDGGYHPIIEIP